MPLPRPILYSRIELVTPVEHGLLWARHHHRIASLQGSPFRLTGHATGIKIERPPPSPIALHPMPINSLSTTILGAWLLSSVASAQVDSCPEPLEWGPLTHLGSFGWAVAIDGDRAVVGKPDHDLPPVWWTPQIARNARGCLSLIHI